VITIEYLKNILSIQEKKISTLAILLITITIYTLYSHYIDKNISDLVNIIQAFLFGFVGINGVEILNQYTEYKSKLSDLNISTQSNTIQTEMNYNNKI